MNVEVTVEDIKNGKRASCSSCPIALALKRAFPDKHIWVDELSIFIDDDCVFNVPDNETVDRFTWDFDLHGVGEPFSFELDVRPWGLE